jgi:3-hydroxyisobutyrate dehydrogenase-like beta-hydroxyacid dehydrogenase
VRLGVIGLGNIGGAVAANLVADGHDVVVHDASAERAAAVAGATALPDAAAVGRAADITFLSLPTPAVVAEVATSWASAAPAGSVVVDLSTNDPAQVRALGETLGLGGRHLVEAPLTGGAPGAARRLLVFMVGGDDEPVARVRPVLETLGRAVVHLGPLGTGNTMKLVNSLVAFCATWSSLEGLSLATKAGIDFRAAVEVIRTAGAGNFWIDRMAESVDTRDRPTEFAIELAAKDAALVVATGADLGVPTPVGAAIADVLAGAVEAGFGGKDWSALVEVAESAATVQLRWEAPR